jgi:hypothetical protein
MMLRVMQPRVAPWNGSEMPPLEFGQRRKCVILDMLAEMLKIALGLSGVGVPDTVQV